MSTTHTVQPAVYDVTEEFKKAEMPETIDKVYEFFKSRELPIVISGCIVSSADRYNPYSRIYDPADRARNTAMHLSMMMVSSRPDLSAEFLQVISGVMNIDRMKNAAETIQ